MCRSSRALILSPLFIIFLFYVLCDIFYPQTTTIQTVKEIYNTKI